MELQPASADKLDAKNNCIHFLQEMTDFEHKRHRMV